MELTAATKEILDDLLMRGHIMDIELERIWDLTRLLYASQVRTTYHIVKIQKLVR